MGALRALRPGPFLSFPTAPQAAPGQAKPSGAPGKQAAKAKAKAKATQAGKLRNSAKGKVPKSALGKVGKGPGCALEEGDREAGLETHVRQP